MKVNPHLLVILLAVGLLTACSTEDVTKENRLPDSQEEQQAYLEEQLAAITQLAESVTCQDADQWSFTSLGSKACGGPSNYIAYSHSIDVSDFLLKVESYTTATAAYNSKWSIVSDCAVTPAPSSVICVSGKAVLVF
ncbi:hypothetical protein N6H18_17680 [Reichenbachiella agarivorans]|uniref:Lipoprotein n=1 Tax=Reichenbachiella agarivorans TaxID=2979464 RepID=A0ABY6CS28_9BACT|nr:hypothetical protein [Reichenbachiella agarivorans]UXP32173.1 hypothetical protein N6H18_17680 [Reichenbachiella agarivorans]